ncbi:spore germination protein XA [Bacillus freudenreichii]|nr:spore germination protein XA [Bacillus freudenreichii]
MSWEKNRKELFKRRNTTPLLSLSEHDVEHLFEDCSDIHFKKLHFNEKESLLVYCIGIIDSKYLNERVIPELEYFFRHHDISYLTDISNLDMLHLQDVKKISSKEELIELVFSGYGVFYFNHSDILLGINMESKPQRQPEESSLEISIKGARDNFIEDITVNMALIRKRLPTNSLRSEEFSVGERSKTAVKVIYIDDIADKKMLQELKERIKTIDIDAIYSGHQFMTLLDNKVSFLPTHDYSGRPDWVVKALVTGRIAILIDGIPYAVIVPVNFLLLVKSPEDTEYSALYGSFSRLIRLMGSFMAALLPGFWVAITSFHSSQMPLTLLATVVESRKGIPLPSALEAILMLLFFELFREAGLRLPIAVGQTLSVVGGLIIGDAAIRAGLTSPSMLVVIAASSVATFTLVNQSLVGVVSLIRLYILIMSSFFGFFGFFLSAFSVVLYMANIRTFGVPYLQVATRISFSDFIKSFFQMPVIFQKYRPNMINSKDKTRRGK